MSLVLVEISTSIQVFLSHLWVDKFVKALCLLHLENLKFGKMPSESLTRIAGSNESSGAHSYYSSLQLPNISQENKLFVVLGTTNIQVLVKTSLIYKLNIK